MGHVADIAAHQRILQRLFLTPAVLGAGVIQESDKCIVRGLTHSQPQVDFCHKAGVVVPHRLVLIPACFRGNALAGDGLHKLDMTAHDGIVGIEDAAGEDSVR